MQLTFTSLLWRVYQRRNSKFLTDPTPDEIEWTIILTLKCIGPKCYTGNDRQTMRFYFNSLTRWLQLEFNHNISSVISYLCVICPKSLLLYFWNFYSNHCRILENVHIFRTFYYYSICFIWFEFPCSSWFWISVHIVNLCKGCMYTFFLRWFFLLRLANESRRTLNKE